MWISYLKLAGRNILRNKLRTAIHIAGLALGITVCFLVFNVIFHAYSFDNFHPRKDDIFRVRTTTGFMDQSFPNVGVPFPLGEVIADELTGIGDKTHFYTLYETMVILPSADQYFGRTNNVIFADPGFFRIFQREWLSGNPGSALESPNSVVLTESSLQKYFPGIDPGDVLGKDLLYVNQDSIIAQVKGVVRDYSENTDFTFTDFISKSTLFNLTNNERFHVDNWQSVNSSSQLFLLLEDGTTSEDIETGLAYVADKYIEAEEGRKTEFSTESLSELHFSQTYTTQRADKTTLRGLSLIVLIILLIACMNFVNLETAQAITRSKEMGIRKTLGCNRSQLIMQFLVETFTLIWLAILASFLTIELALHYFKDFLPGEMVVTFFSWRNISFLLGLSLFLTLVAGLYPAVILASYEPVKAMKEEKAFTSGFSFGVFLRKSLTVIQFTLSIAFIISVLAIHRQISFLSEKELGFDKEVVLYSYTPYKDPLSRNYILKSQLEQESVVKAVSLSSEMIAAQSLWTTTIQYGGESEKNEYEVQVKLIDKDYLEVHGVQLLSGRNIRETPKETLVNQAMVYKLGFENPDEIIGETLDYNKDKLIVVGVTGDFHTRSLRETIRPIIMYHDPSSLHVVNVKLASGASISQAQTNLSNILKSVYRDEDLNFAFLDSVIGKFYLEDRKLRSIFRFASGLAILISCMGLFGLSSFTITKRMKELSIRKVLGASVAQIIRLISREYLTLVGIAFLLGSVPAWFFLNDWLSTFSYRIDMPWRMFTIAGMLALSLCILIVGLHAMKASRRNPAEILRSE